MPYVPIKRPKIGDNQPVVLILEGRVNHNGELKMVHQLTDIEPSPETDPIKFQTSNTVENHYS